VTEKIGRLDRFAERVDRAEVHFSEERNPRIDKKEACEVTLYGRGHIIRAKVAANDQFAAVDLAVDKLEHQLHKLKSREVDRHHGKARAKANGTKSVVAIQDEADGAPRVVKVKRFALKPMTQDEAVLQMELLGHEFYLFIQADTGTPAVVYQRTDGDVGLIEVER
jgi:putative sigma-54 modulation protein